MNRILSLNRSSIDLMTLFVACMTLLLHALFVIHETDDLFISLRYADNIAVGLGPVYNVGEFVEGYTTPLWVFLLGALRWLGASLLPTAKFLSLLSGLISLCLLLPLGRAWGMRGERLAVLLLALNSTFAVWSSAAMEMTLFTLFLLAALLLLARKQWLISGLLFGLAILTRPEGVLWLAISLLCVLWQTKKTDGLIEQLLPSIKVGVGASFLVIPHELWRLSYYGELLPNTFYNKVGLSEAVLWRGIEYLSAAGQDYFFALTLFLFLAFLIPAIWRKGRAVFGFLIVAQLAYVILVGGDWMAAYRFLVPAVPLVCLMVAHLIYELRDQAPNHVKSITTVALIGSILAVQLFTSLHLSNELRDNYFFTQELVQDGYQIATMINTHCTPDVSLALFAAGSVGYYAINHSVVDMFGLITPEVTRSPTSNIGEGMAGHERFNAQVVRALQPDLYVFQTQFDKEPITDEKGWREVGLAHLIRQFTDEPSFWAEHSTRTVEIEPGLFWNFAIRHDAACQWE